MKTVIFTLILTFAFGCFGQIQTDQKFKLKVNEQKTVTEKNLTVKFVSVLEDSRCPEDTNCIQAGNAKVQIKIKKPKVAWKTFELNTSGEQTNVSFEGCKIRIIDLTPVPKSNIRINRNGYTATFEICKL